MANEGSISGVAEDSEHPTINTLSLSDIPEVLGKGFEDFKAAPTHALFLVIIYPVLGLLLLRIAIGAQVLSLVFPLLAGFTLLGPVAVIGVYELSRRREMGLPVSWTNVFAVFKMPSIGSILIMVLFLFSIFVAWLWSAQGLYRLFIADLAPAELDVFVGQILFTDAGHQLIVVGNIVGLFYAVLVFICTAVSFPLLLDRKTSAVQAIAVSLRVVFSNLPVMTVWGCVIAMLLAVASIPALLGLTVVVPVLGHASWHLYRKAVSYP